MLVAERGVGIAAASLVGAGLLVPFIGGGFTPQTDSSEFVVQFEAPEGANLAFTRGRAEALAAELRALPGVAYTYTTIGAGATGTVREGETYVRLVPSAERAQSQQELMVAARARLRRVFGLETAILEPGGPGGATAPIAVQITGPEVDVLQRLADSDNANDRRRSGLGRREALVEAGAARLRPIVMTTVAMVAGMLPVALALGEGGGFRAPMARAVIGGLVTSTLLTLVVVPVAYTYFDDAGGWLGRLPARLRGAARARAGRRRAARRDTPEPAFGD